MRAVVLYFQVHQPYRLRPFGRGEVGSGAPYFDDELDAAILRRVAARCYGPANGILAATAERLGDAFACSLSLTGTVIEQLRQHAPDVLASFASLAATGRVEILGETAYHSLASVACSAEFEAQVEQHRALVGRLLGAAPGTFRNTELVLDRAIAARIEQLGFSTVLGEGADRLLQGRSAQHIYRPVGCRALRVLLRSYRLSDDIAFRFRGPPPLDAAAFAERVAATAEPDGVVGLFLDYESFGEHHPASSGVLELLRELPDRLLEHGLTLHKPSELPAGPCPPLDYPDAVSWADQPRDLGAWLGNPMQRAAHDGLYALRESALRAGAEGAPELLETWRRLSTSDHFYYMATRPDSDGYVHAHFTPLGTPQHAFAAYMNALADLRLRLRH